MLGLPGSLSLHLTTVASPEKPWQVNKNLTRQLKSQSWALCTGWQAGHPSWLAFPPRLWAHIKAGPSRTHLAKKVPSGYLLSASPVLLASSSLPAQALAFLFFFNKTWWNPSWAISNPKRWCCESAALNMSANLENSAVATGLEKVSFHSSSKERKCQRMLKLTCTRLTC